MNSIRWSWRLAVWFFLLVAGTVSGADDPADRDVIVSYAMLDNPRIEFPPPVIVLPTSYVELWMETLEVPDTELQRQLTVAIERAHREGHADFSLAVPRFREMVRDSQAPLELKASAASALLTFEDRESAPDILELCKSAGPTLAHIAEPVLARWEYEPAISMWLARLNDVASRRHELRLAVECLATVRESRASAGLKGIVLNPEHDGTLRLAAARSWGAIQRHGLEETARSFVSQTNRKSLPDRLMGASLLRYHDSKQARELLLSIATDSEPAVALIAWDRLLEIDSVQAASIAETTLESPDARLRFAAVRAMDEHPTTERLRALAPLLSDPHPDVRNEIRRVLTRHDQDPSWGPTIRSEAVGVLETDDWRGLEQAGMLLAVLDHEPVAPRFLELLEHPRPEVAVMAAWGLRVLAVPETLPPMLAYAQQITDSGFEPRESFFPQSVHLFEAFGLMDYQPAGPLLRQFIPKNPPPVKEDDSRGAAIWALGLLHASEPDRGLVRQLVGRLQDVDSEDPESDFVRRFAAITLGRMQAESALSDLQGEARGQAPPADEVDFACRWAIEQLTGTPVLDPVPRVQPSLNWFLVPLDQETRNE